jgi:hypothetical protein
MPVVWHSRPTGRYDSSFSAPERHPEEGFLPGNKNIICGDSKAMISIQKINKGIT